MTPPLTDAAASGPAMASPRIAWLACAGLIAVLVLAWLALAPGQSGGFIFDDSWNLRDLEGIQQNTTLAQALQYSFSGISSALGRPLALVTFAAQFYSWPWHPDDFVRVNILLHLLNGVLLFGCIVQLMRLLRHPEPQALGTALAVAALWLWAPLQASAVLYVVQRMAVLSATCMFGGLLAYLAGRRRWLESEGARGVVPMSLGLVLGTGLGILAKENAILLPLGVVVLEATLLRELPRGRHWKVWAAIFLGVPTAVVFGYLASRLPGLLDNAQERGFTPLERLLTESRVLFLYLRKLVLPSLYSIRLLYDDLAVSRGLLSPATTLPSVLAWIALLVAAVRGRRRAPVFAFAVLWFLSQHLLESTIVPLELAFEHRNYVASIGPIFALVWYGGRLIGEPSLRRVRRPVQVAAAALFAFQLAALWQSATLWGRPVDLARYWARHQPDSIRSQLQLADSYLAYGDYGSAVAAFEHAMQRFPNDPTLPLALMEVGCSFPDGPVPPFSRLEDSIRHFDAQQLSTLNLLDRLIGDMEDGHCKRYPPAEIYRIVSMVIESPQFQRHRRNLYLLRSRVAELAGDRPQAMADLRTALDMQDLLPLLVQAVIWSLQSGDAPAARGYVERAERIHPLNPFQRYLAQRTVRRLHELVEDYERRHPAAAPGAGTH